MRFIFLFLFLIPHVGQATNSQIGQKDTSQSDACSKYLQISDINYSELRKLVPNLRSKIFKNRNASLIELKPLIEELKIHFETVRPETTAEVAGFPAEAQARGDDQVSLGQLITKPNNFADNVDRNSDNFHFHDINHAYLYLEFDDELNWNSKIKTLAEFNRVLQARKDFKDSVRKAIARVDTDSRIFIQLWYQIFHERPLEYRLMAFEPSLRIGESRLHKIVPTAKSVVESFKHVDLKFYADFLSLEMKAHYGVSDERAKRMAQIAVDNLLK